MEIRSALNVGKVLIGGKKQLPASFDAISDNCFHGPNNPIEYFFDPSLLQNLKKKDQKYSR